MSLLVLIFLGNRKISFKMAFEVWFVLRSSLAWPLIGWLLDHLMLGLDLITLQIQISFGQERFINVVSTLFKDISVSY